MKAHGEEVSVHVEEERSGYGWKALKVGGIAVGALVLNFGTNYVLDQVGVDESSTTNLIKSTGVVVVSGIVWKDANKRRDNGYTYGLRKTAAGAGVVAGLTVAALSGNQALKDNDVDLSDIEAPDFIDEDTLEGFSEEIQDRIKQIEKLTEEQLGDQIGGDSASTVDLSPYINRNSTVEPDGSVTFNMSSFIEAISASTTCAVENNTTITAQVVNQDDLFELLEIATATPPELIDGMEYYGIFSQITLVEGDTVIYGTCS